MVEDVNVNDNDNYMTMERFFLGPTHEMSGVRDRGDDERGHEWKACYFDLRFPVLLGTCKVVMKVCGARDEQSTVVPPLCRGHWYVLHAAFAPSIPSFIAWRSAAKSVGTDQGADGVGWMYDGAWNMLVLVRV